MGDVSTPKVHAATSPFWQPHGPAFLSFHPPPTRFYFTHNPDPWTLKRPFAVFRPAAAPQVLWLAKNEIFNSLLGRLGEEGPGKERVHGGVAFGAEGVRGGEEGRPVVSCSKASTLLVEILQRYRCLSVREGEG